jgi:hypothetical protein
MRSGVETIINVYPECLFAEFPSFKKDGEWLKEEVAEMVSEIEQGRPFYFGAELVDVMYVIGFKCRKPYSFSDHVRKLLDFGFEPEIEAGILYSILKGVARRVLHEYSPEAAKTYAKSGFDCLRFCQAVALYHKDPKDWLMQDFEDWLITVAKERLLLSAT